MYRIVLVLLLGLLLGCSSPRETPPPPIPTPTPIATRTAPPPTNTPEPTANPIFIIYDTPAPVEASIGTVIMYNGQTVTLTQRVLINPVSNVIVTRVTTVTPVTTVTLVTTATPVTTTTTTTPTTADHDICDEIQRNHGPRGDRCLAWRGFTIDHRCYDNERITEILIAAGWAAEHRADARQIISAESGGCANAIDAAACGLFMIAYNVHTAAHSAFASSNCYNAENNARFARAIFEANGHRWEHWATADVLTPRATVARAVATPTPAPAPISAEINPTSTPPAATPWIETPVPPPASTYDVTLTPIVMSAPARPSESGLPPATVQTLELLNCNLVVNVANGGGWLCVEQHGRALTATCDRANAPWSVVLEVHPASGDARWFDREGSAWGAYGVITRRFTLPDENPFDCADNTAAAQRQWDAGETWRWPWSLYNWQP